VQLGALPPTTICVGDVSMGDAASPKGKGLYAIGEIVDYYSATKGAWIPAKVLKVNDAGTVYSLDCKPDVPAEKLRRREVTFQGAEFKAGDVVEYESASQRKWIPACVLAVNARGAYDLDCKPDVAPHRVRRPVAAAPEVGDARGARVGVEPWSPERPELATSFRLPALRPKPAALLTDFDAPVQLLRVHRSGGQWRYEVCPEGAEALERYGSRRISVASVCGLYRTGKSFLLNLLLERVQRGLPLFKVGSTTRSCTEGLWLYGSMGGADDDRSPLLAFLDCEGFGSTDSDRQRDAQLMTLCALLSSVLVLNTRGALNESLFNALALACRFAEHVEERGHEASRPSLLWVLRDFMLELRDESGRPQTPDEYLEQALRATPVSSYDMERSQSAREVRESVLKFFGHRGCATLVQPAIEETDLQDLENVPYNSLRSEFRAGVEALRAQLIAACHASPKTVGGEPISCRSFAALLRQLVEALNASKSLSVKGAWEAMQHGSCSRLADELRAQGSEMLRALALGQRVEGGGSLPMSDEALRELFRLQRHNLKSQWDERAVGEEGVRNEYWQELKESLAREEVLVKQQNARLADQKLSATLKRWQDWLDDDDDADAAAGARAASDLGQLMDSLPTAPLSRAGRSALEAAARRVVAARAAIAATEDHYSEAKRKAEEFGVQASQLEGAARSELEAKTRELEEAQERLKRLEHSSSARQMELQAKTAELQDARAQVDAAMQDVEDAKQREHELRAQHRITNEREVALKAELEEARAAAARSEGERLAAEGAARASAEGLASEQERLERELKDAKAEAERFAAQVEAERRALRAKHDRHREEHARLAEDAHRKVEVERSAIMGEHERAHGEQSRMLTEARARLEDDRRKQAEALDGEQQRLLEGERRAGVLEGQVDAISGETASLRERIAQLQVALREAETKAGRHKAEGDRLRAEVDRAKAEAERAKIDAENRVRAKESELDKENFRLTEERSAGTKAFSFNPFRGRRSKLPGGPKA